MFLVRIERLNLYDTNYQVEEISVFAKFEASLFSFFKANTSISFQQLKANTSISAQQASANNSNLTAVTEISVDNICDLKKMKNHPFQALRKG